MLYERTPDEWADLTAISTLIGALTGFVVGSGLVAVLWILFS